MRILGIDPGYAIVGWGVVDFENNRFRTVDFGAIRTKAGTDTVDRLEKIYDGINQIIDKYATIHKTKVTKVNTKTIFFSLHPDISK